MSLGQYHELPTLCLTQCPGSFPFGGVDSPAFHVVDVASGFSTRFRDLVFGIWWDAILLGFDFDDAFVKLAIFLANQDPEVGEVPVGFAVDGGLVGDDQFFARPFYHRRVVVAIPHEAEFEG